jgi:hypothetical protein
MQKRRFAAEQAGKRVHKKDCTGLYSTMCLFTSLMVTKEGRKSIRKFLCSEQDGVHDPLLLARYVFAPINHILHHHLLHLTNKLFVSKEAQVQAKLKWVVRLILAGRMLEILGEKGLQPDCQYTSDYQKKFMGWIVGPDSTWGLKHPKGIVGVTQMAFQAYAVKMEDEHLFEVFLQGTKPWNMDGLFKQEEDLRAFLLDDYGLKPANHIKTFVDEIIQGKRPIVHQYATQAYDKSLKTRVKNVTSKKAGLKTTGLDLINDMATEATRTSGRKNKHSENYAEASAEDDEESEAGEKPPKRARFVRSWAALARGVEQLKVESVRLTKNQLIERMETLLGECVPGVGKVRFNTVKDENQNNEYNVKDGEDENSDNSEQDENEDSEPDDEKDNDVNSNSD